MLYRIYTQFMENSAKGVAPLIIGAIANQKNGDDALIECLKLDGSFGARIDALYASVRDGRPLRREIVRPLSSEFELSIKELKKEAIRLAFFVDNDFRKKELKGVKTKAIVLLLYFPKHDNKATQRAIKKAKQIRNEFLELNRNDSLQIEVI